MGGRVIECVNTSIKKDHRYISQSHEALFRFSLLGGLRSFLVFRLFVLVPLSGRLPSPGASRGVARGPVRRLNVDRPVGRLHLVPGSHKLGALSVIAITLPLVPRHTFALLVESEAPVWIRFRLELNVAIFRESFDERATSPSFSRTLQRQKNQSVYTTLLESAT